MTARSRSSHLWAKPLYEGACHEPDRIARISVSRPFVRSKAIQPAWIVLEDLSMIASLAIL